MDTSTKDNTIEEIKSRCNIVDVIGRVVPLKKAGSNYKGLCPFHNEKTPSFVVSENKQIFTCFGCGATGDVISFIQRYYNYEFMQAVEKLTDEYGIDISLDYGRSEKKEELYRINKEAATFFYRAFLREKNPAAEYMKKRGIDSTALKKFGIGYADDSWDSLYRHMTGKGTDPEKLLSLGLVSHSKDRYYDKFRNRVIFPIINTGGKVIGFGGRAIGDDMPKYLNSPESSVFLKKNNLYGLNLTREDISKEDRAILVEGYMDVISLYQGGVRNVSASLGTSLTEGQAQLLKRYTRNVAISYDSDEAGRNAALRGMEILHDQDCRVKVVTVSQGKDPDDFIREKGKEAYVKLVDEAPYYADYKLQLLEESHDLATDQGKVDYLKGAVRVLSRLSPVEADIYIKKIAKDAKISESAIRLEINGNNIQQKPRARQHNEKEEPKTPAQITALEKMIIKLLLTNSSYVERIKPYDRVFDSSSGRNIYNVIVSIFTEGVEIDINKLTDTLEEKDSTCLNDIMDNIFLAGKEEQIFRDCIRALEEKELEEREKELIMRLSMADEVENRDSIKELTEELISIQSKKIDRG